MARTITLKFDDGSEHVYENVPDNITPDQVMERASSDFKGKAISNIDGGKKSTVNPNPTGISKLESGAKGALQGATLGFADELSGITRALFEGVSPSDPNQSRLEAIKSGYQSSRDERRAENAAAQKANPLSYGAGEIAGSVTPLALTGGATLPASMAKTSVAMGTGAFGAAEGDLANQGTQALKGAVVGAALPVAAKGVGLAGEAVKNFTKGRLPESVVSAANKIKDVMPGSAARKSAAAEAEAALLRTNPEARALAAYDPAFIKEYKAILATGDKEAIAKAEEELVRRQAAKLATTEAAAADASQAAKDAAYKGKFSTKITNDAVNATIGAGGAMLTGNDPWLGVIAGATGGRLGKFKTAERVGAAAGIAGRAGEAVVNSAATKAATQALVNMTGDQAATVKKKYEPRIQAAVEKGQPVYAATFSALSSSPELRAAQAADEAQEAEDDKLYTEKGRYEDETDDNE